MNVTPVPMQAQFQQGPWQPSNVIIHQHSAPAQPVPIIVQQPVRPVFVAPSFTDRPARTVCPNPSCGYEIMTQLTYKVGLLGWIIFGTMIFVGCWLGCCLIPFFVNGLKDVEHTCPRCSYNIYTYKRM
ncbi:lipopolysaccharide-induced tumor necrosis factor-alpha factor homolog [Scyliorhinus canicula]|uniref:lipopolysaccharide-induced tumor necrosis factor-alpha factor homolog n=1 Tax=Scyliorhinus canicula TaxID=7830 RepID=UPI0018F4110E|nr:lipopolysaccharide-induced tumor necrosis factor-alpha factor homolog [Scyliorhinus canicula]